MINSEKGMFGLGIVNYQLTLKAQNAPDESDCNQLIDTILPIKYTNDQNIKYFNVEKLKNDCQQPQNYICVRDQDAFQI